MKLQNKTTTSRLGGYLTAAVSCGTLASTASAAIVTIDISSISGVNGGITSGNFGTFQLSSLSPGITGQMEIYNNSFVRGLDADSGMYFATAGAIATPTKFSTGATIDSSASFLSSFASDSVFRYGGYTAPDFGPGSFIGFRSDNGKYGYFEVTWTSATDTFQILSGAYEDQIGVGIAAGAVPEPSTAMLSLGALAAGAMIRRRKQAA